MYWYSPEAVLVQGNAVLVQGNAVLVQGNAVLVQGNAVLVQGNAVLVQGNAVLVQGNAVLVQGNAVLVQPVRHLRPLPRTCPTLEAPPFALENVAVLPDSTRMPSFPHELPLALFRRCPELVPRLLEALQVELPRYREARIVESNLTQLTPTEYHADLVVTLYDDRSRPVLGIVVEVQRQIDLAKPWSWPLYVVGLRARLEIPVVLLVFCDDEKVAGWARRPIFIGGDWWYWPSVLGPEQVPWVKTQDVAQKLPELAVLSAVAHGNEPAGMEVLLPTIEALMALDEGRKGFYYDVVLRSLNEAMRWALEKEMKMQEGKYEYQSDFARAYFGQGKAEGRAEALLAVLEARGMAPDDSTRERIMGCTDPEQLQRWIVRAATMTSLREVFAEP
jgi:hypothetical protein